MLVFTPIDFVLLLRLLEKDTILVFSLIVLSVAVFEYHFDGFVKIYN